MNKHFNRQQLLIILTTILLSIVLALYQKMNIWNSGNAPSNTVWQVLFSLFSQVKKMILVENIQKGRPFKKEGHHQRYTSQKRLYNDSQGLQYINDPLCHYFGVPGVQCGCWEGFREIKYCWQDFKIWVSKSIRYGIVFVLVLPAVNPETKIQMLIFNLVDNIGHPGRGEGV